MLFGCLIGGMNELFCSLIVKPLYKTFLFSFASYTFKQKKLKRNPSPFFIWWRFKLTSYECYRSALMDGLKEKATARPDGFRLHI